MMFDFADRDGIRYIDHYMIVTKRRFVEIVIGVDFIEYFLFLISKKWKIIKKNKIVMYYLK